MASTSCRDSNVNKQFRLKGVEEMGLSTKVQRPEKTFKQNYASETSSDPKAFLRNSSEIKDDEKRLLKKIDDAWQRKDLQEILELINENNFTEMAQKKVVEYWDMCHYYQESVKRKKPLTPLARFRIRERFLPPKHICPNGRKKATLPREATKVLRGWLESNTRPYPTREDKISLAEQSGLSIIQVNTWFANTRRRLRGRRKTQRNAARKTGSPVQEACQSLIASQPWPMPYFQPVMTTSQAVFPSCSTLCTYPGQFPQFLAPLSLGRLHLLNSASPKWVRQRLGFRRPPPVSDHFVVHQGWSLTRELTDTNLRLPWQDISANVRALMEWRGSQSAAVGNQHLPPSLVALAPKFWEPELQHCGLHAAAQILMDMASK